MAEGIKKWWAGQLMPMLFYGLIGKHALEIEFMICRFKFGFQGINSESYLVYAVVHHSLFIFRCSSLIDRDFWHCCQFFKLYTARQDFSCNMNYEGVLLSLRPIGVCAIAQRV